MIPFCKTTLGEEEKKAVAEVIDSGWVVMGEKTEEFEQKFAEYVGAHYAVFLNSCTSALFLSLKALDIGEGDKIAVPSFTFTATAESIVHAGAKLYFVDIDLHNFCLNRKGDESTKIKNYLPVHLMGNRSTFSKAIIYDSAHRIEKDDIKENDFALWCYSFYATKNMTTIQGGMVATNNKIYADWIRKARDHGLSKGTKERYKDGVSDYSVDFIGWRMKPSDVDAAIGLEQLKKLPWMTDMRNRAVARYNASYGLKRVGNHIYPIFVENRAYFLNFMKEHNIQCSVHFKPLHKMPAYQEYKKEDLTNTEYLSEHIISLPLYPMITEDEIDFVVKTSKASGVKIYEQ